MQAYTLRYLQVLLLFGGLYYIVPFVISAEERKRYFPGADETISIVGATVSLLGALYFFLMLENQRLEERRHGEWRGDARIWTRGGTCLVRGQSGNPLRSTRRLI